LTEKILNKGKQRIDTLELVPYGDGRFEVFKNDKRLHSKLETGEFPDEDKLIKQLL
jgi:selenoprotein W-related protein